MHHGHRKPEAGYKRQLPKSFLPIAITDMHIAERRFRSRVLDTVNLFDSAFDIYQ
jgi:hypothetical protein